MQDTIQIAGLEPVIRPDAVPFWPPAPGWYIVGALILFALAYAIYLMIRKWDRNCYRKLALAHLELLKKSSLLESNEQRIAALNTLLKRTALTAYPREFVASLSGDKWIQFLDNTYPSKAFLQFPGNLLGEMSYTRVDTASISDEDFKTLIENCRVWIKKHRTNNIPGIIY